VIDILDRIIKIRNGDRLVNFRIYKCDKCECKIEECWPHIDTSENNSIGDNAHYCLDCAFKLGLITGDLYLKYKGYDFKKYHAGINPDGEIEVWFGKSIPPWERKCTKRSSPEYVQWRAKVFERDDYTCQKCGQRGGVLNAHHIKSYAKYKKLRTDVTNGITLCEVCHKKEHRRRD
jgi:hypothetical protein